MARPDPMLERIEAFNRNHGGRMIVRRVASGCRDLIWTGLREGNLAHPIGRVTQTFLVDLHDRRFAEHLGRIAAVYRDLDLLRGCCVGKFDLEVEFGANKNFCARQWVNRLGCRLSSRYRENRKSQK